MVNWTVFFKLAILILCYSFAHHMVKAADDSFQLAVASLALSFMQQQQVNIDLSTMSLVSMCHQPRLPSSVSPSCCVRVEMNTHTPPPPPGLQQSVLGYLSLGICSSGCFPVVPISWSLKHCLNQVTLKWGRKKKQREKDEKVELTFVSLF